MRTFISHLPAVILGLGIGWFSASANRLDPGVAARPTDKQIKLAMEFFLRDTFETEQLIRNAKTEEQAKDAFRESRKQRDWSIDFRARCEGISVNEMRRAIVDVHCWRNGEPRLDDVQLDAWFREHY